MSVFLWWQELEPNLTFKYLTNPYIGYTAKKGKAISNLIISGDGYEVFIILVKLTYN